MFHIGMPLGWSHGLRNASRCQRHH
jgi:hypothetical protein